MDSSILQRLLVTCYLETPYLSPRTGVSPHPPERQLPSCRWSVPLPSPPSATPPPALIRRRLLLICKSSVTLGARLPIRLSRAAPTAMPHAEWLGKIQALAPQPSCRPAARAGEVAQLAGNHSTLLQLAARPLQHAGGNAHRNPSHIHRHTSLALPALAGGWPACGTKGRPQPDRPRPLHAC
jgi:hypothetical protein